MTGQGILLKYTDSSLLKTRQPPFPASRLRQSRPPLELGLQWVCFSGAEASETVPGNEEMTEAIIPPVGACAQLPP
jgi:hypothetical protein